ncbi:hypothetical protein MKW98_002542 [Papaver atlanticum]|uniref:BRO1 domain-containing protein n=1 Tax=Papaver atlanticum TaxID=357466 RepID=A0AAD4SAE6_9MAGN|nr:hypothetical protein MKW98_002542 [Papaver atlanticum]
MMLHFSDPAKLKTKRIIFEEIYGAGDPSTLMELKELSARRRAIEESINETSVTAKATAREMAGGLTSRREQDLLKLELYLPLLENLVFHATSSGNVVSGVELKISWSSALSSVARLNFGGCKFFNNDELCFELGMTLFLYGAILRERAQEVLLTGDLVKSSKLYRKAAGVYHHLFQTVLPSLKPAVGQEKPPPPETTPSLSSVMNFICLAEAQGAVARKAVENGTSVGLLSKLDYGIKELLDQAYSILNASNEKCKLISTKLEEFICFSRSLHELRSKRYLAGSLKNDHIGLAIGVLRRALGNIKGAPKEESWQLVFKQEIETVSEMLRKLEHENNEVFHVRVPIHVDQLPSPESKKIVTGTPYDPKRSETKLVFKKIVKPRLSKSQTM